MGGKERIQLLTKILVEFDSQRMQIEFTVEKIEQLYSHDLDDKNPVPMLP